MLLAMTRFRSSSIFFFFFSSRRRHTRLVSDWSSDVCSSDLNCAAARTEWNGVVQRAASLGHGVRRQHLLRSRRGDDDPRFANALRHRQLPHAHCRRNRAVCWSNGRSYQHRRSRPPGWHSLALLRAGVFRGCPVGLHGANAWVVVLRGKKKAEGDCECGSEGMTAHLRKTSENYRFRGTSDYLVAFDHGPAKNGPLEAPA